AASARVNPTPLSVTSKDNLIRPRAAFVAVTANAMRPRSVNFTALSIKFSSMARSRTASPTTSSGSSPIAISGVSPAHSARAPRRFGGARRHRGDGGDKGAQGERREPQRELAAIRTRAIDDERGELAEMLGRAFHRGRPGALALWEVGGRDQFAQRQNAGQRR